MYGQIQELQVILLTQPYAVDGHMTEEEQMNVYRKNSVSLWRG